MDKATLQKKINSDLEIVGKFLEQPGGSDVKEAFLRLSKLLTSEVTIDPGDMVKIRDWARMKFHSTKTFPSDDPENVQLYLLMYGFESFLLSKDIVPNFIIKEKENRRK